VSENRTFVSAPSVVRLEISLADSHVRAVRLETVTNLPEALPAVSFASTVLLDQWFSKGAPQEVATYASNIMKVYFKNETKPISTEIYYIHDFYFYS
jgi:hypothetical protein